MRTAYLLGVHLAWAVLLLFHPNPDPGDVYGSLHHEVDRWLAVHLGTLVFIGLLGAAVFVLLDGCAGTAARISRVGAGVFVLLYGAGEAILGVAVGVLVRHGDQAGAQVLWDDFVTDDLVVTVGAIGWVVAVLAAAVALRQAGGPLAASILVASSAIVVLHGPPVGPLGLVLFAAGVATGSPRPPEPRSPTSPAEPPWPGRPSAASPGC